MDLVTPARKWAAAEAAESPAAKAEIVAEAPAAESAPAERMPLFQSIVMFCSVVGPLLGLIVGIVLLWNKNSPIGIGWPELVAMIIMYAICGYGVTIGFHRLLTHRAFETYRPLRLALAIMGSSAGQGMCIRWCATHRRHHQVSDREGDPHSPHLHGGEGLWHQLKGMFHAHVFWCFDADCPDTARSIKDLTDDKALLLIDQLYFFWVALGCLIPAVALGLYHHTWQGFCAGLIWGGIARIGLVQHVTWSVNSVCHVWGFKEFDSSDHSVNNPIVGFLALGEGWHNNHHAFPTSARHGLRWWQFDSSYLLIRAMSAVGLAWNVRLPSESALQAKLCKA